MRQLPAVLFAVALLAACGGTSDESSSTTSTPAPAADATSAPPGADSPAPDASPTLLCTGHNGVKSGAGVANPGSGKTVVVVVICGDDSVDTQNVDVFN